MPIVSRCKETLTIVTIKVELHEGDEPCHDAIQSAVNHKHYSVVKVETQDIERG